MKIAIVGGTGFVGRHLARSLSQAGHAVVLVARGVDRRDEEILQFPGVTFVRSALSDEEKLAQAFSECQAVAHCAGIIREIGNQTYENVHVVGAQSVVNAARKAGVKKIVLVSVPDAASDSEFSFYRSKWKGEEIVRNSGLDFTILKPGIVYGDGDHLLDHLSRILRIFPVFPLLGKKENPIRPVSVDDVVRILEASLIEGKLSCKTVLALGPEELPFKDVVMRIAQALGKKPLVLPAPLAVHYLFAWISEKFMRNPIVSIEQVRLLAKGMSSQPPGHDELPQGLKPFTRFTIEQIRKGLPKEIGTAPEAMSGLGLSLKGRIKLALFAFLATSAYALSFLSLPQNFNWIDFGRLISIAAALTWPIFGMILLMMTRRQVPLFAWIDTCLLTMRIGNIVLFSGILLNLTYLFHLYLNLPILAILHEIILAISNLAMGTFFVRRSLTLGLKLWKALFLWLFALDGTFGIVLMLLNSF